MSDGAVSDGQVAVPRAEVPPQRHPARPTSSCVPAVPAGALRSGPTAPQAAGTTRPSTRRSSKKRPGQSGTDLTKLIPQNRTRRVHRSRRPPRAARVCCAARSPFGGRGRGIMPGHGERAHVGASMNSSGSQQPSTGRGSGTRTSHSPQTGTRSAVSVQTPDSSPAGTSIREDSSAARSLPEVG
jgi:hypothetical protein